MNISDDEIAAACAAYGNTAAPGRGPWEAALQAAYAVRDAKQSSYRPMFGKVEQVERILQAELDKMDKFTGAAG